MALPCLAERRRGKPGIGSNPISKVGSGGCHARYFVVIGSSCLRSGPPENRTLLPCLRDRCFTTKLAGPQVPCEGLEPSFPFGARLRAGGCAATACRAAF